MPISPVAGKVLDGFASGFNQVLGGVPPESELAGAMSSDRLHNTANAMTHEPTLGSQKDPSRKAQQQTLGLKWKRLREAAHQPVVQHPETHSQGRDPHSRVHGRLSGSNPAGP